MKYIPDPTKDSKGFSLIETLMAMTITTVAMLGAAQAINYSIVYNSGNASRAQNIAILQQEAERLRAAKFTPAGVDNAAPPGNGLCRTDDQRDITGGVKTPCTIPAPNGGSFKISTWVDDNPFNSPNTFDIDATTRLKQITLEVTLASPSPGWQTAVATRVVIRRTIGN